jgi:hypothetical protein
VTGCSPTWRGGSTKLALRSSCGRHHGGDDKSAPVDRRVGTDQSGRAATAGIDAPRPLRLVRMLDRRAGPSRPSSQYRANVGRAPRANPTWGLRSGRSWRCEKRPVSIESSYVVALGAVQRC